MIFLRSNQRLSTKLQKKFFEPQLRPNLTNKGVVIFQNTDKDFSDLQSSPLHSFRLSYSIGGRDKGLEGSKLLFMC